MKAQDIAAINEQFSDMERVSVFALVARHIVRLLPEVPVPDATPPWP